MQAIYLAIPLAPLFGAIAAGLFGKQIGRTGAHWVTILGVAIAFVLSCVVAYDVMALGNTFNGAVYTWASVGNIRFEVGFMLDNLSTMMMLVVTFVSLMVHIYTIGYMHDDPGYQRFFSYISLFTFAMLMLVMSNNFLQLFFGWEAVGLVSYLLIGFWFKKDTAIYANMKAFLVNRVGDFGFLLGIAAILMYFQSLDYATVFANVPNISGNLEFFSGVESDALTVIAILLFIGAMGKSAQVPLHVWLPDSMEGPTPISALIHAATMVTAGIFMVARMSPIFEFSDTALNLILVVGATTAFFMGLIGIVQNDIKRVVAYSTLSQLGYMTVALGASAYSAGVFHLMTHAFFKALLFLAAGSVIMAMHHEQDIRKMGGLKKYMPITYWTALIGSLALIGFPGFAGFFSKDLIIESVRYSNLAAANYAYVLVLLGVFVTAFYSFRMFFLVFHGKERFAEHGHDAHHGHHDDHHHGHAGKPHESPWVVTLPLVLLAIPSVFAGYLIDPLVVGDFFLDSIYVNDTAHGLDRGLLKNVSFHNAIESITSHYHGVLGFILHGLTAAPFWLAMAGLLSAWYIYMKDDRLAQWAYAKLGWLHRLLDRKYYMDEFNQQVFAKGSVGLGNGLMAFGERLVIDGLVVNGSARVVGWFAALTRQLQTGYLYHYAFSMVAGILLMLTWFLFF